MPVWLLALQIALQDAPAVIQAIEISKLPALPPEYMAQLQASMDAAVARMDTAIAKKFPHAARSDVTVAGENTEL